jgi:2-haloacid dehalogenase
MSGIDAMPARMSRRACLGLSAAGVATGLVVSSPLAAAATGARIRAIAFDGLAVFDPRPVFTLAGHLFPGQGAELSTAWRTRQFEYAWLRTLSGQYVDFWHVTEDALVFAARSLGLELTPDKRRRLMQAYLEIDAWPDARSALRVLREAGIRLALLSNFTAAMLDAAIGRSGLHGIFEPHLTTDRISAYKPDPRAYRMALDAFGLRRDEIAFAAFAGWDAFGARSFGYPTVWVNRMNRPLEELGTAPDAIGGSLHDLVRFVRSG